MILLPIWILAADQLTEIERELRPLTRSRRNNLNGMVLTHTVATIVAKHVLLSATIGDRGQPRGGRPSPLTTLVTVPEATSILLSICEAQVRFRYGHLYQYRSRGSCQDKDTPPPGSFAEPGVKG